LESLHHITIKLFFSLDDLPLYNLILLSIGIRLDSGRGAKLFLDEVEHVLVLLHELKSLAVLLLVDIAEQVPLSEVS